MAQNFTPEFLLRYLYKETSASETLAVNEALYQNPDLLAEYEALQQAHQQLPQVKFSPSANTLQKILCYSEQTAIEKTA